MGSGLQRELSLTFEGALRILGKHEHSKIEKIDKLLGGVILGGGAVAGAVALGVTPLAPVAAFGVVWEWVEQKGLAIGLLTSAVDAASGRLSGMRGLEKRELIAAAHSTIVVAAIFESLRDRVGRKFFETVNITDDEKIAVIAQMGSFRREANVRELYSFAIPVPSGSCGFEENVKNVAGWQEGCIGFLAEFFGGLAVAEKARINWGAVHRGAIDRYRSRYLELAAKVPEFEIWAQLEEHAATRTAVREVGAEIGRGIAALTSDVAELSTGVEEVAVAVRESNADVITALSANRNALNRMAALLSAASPHGTGNGPDGTELPGAEMSALRAAVRRANVGILGKAIIPADPKHYPKDLTIPQVSEIYINPRYRVAQFSAEAEPAADSWWGDRETRDDFDILLAAHVTSPDATRRPMLLLGHPGAGKSLLTKVFAAQLPVSDYTVVRVPLRRVSADSRVHLQIEEALELFTDQKIAWSDLGEQSGDTIRVVLLDGLDELLQASAHDKSSYLQDVMDFQERAAEQRRPVVVVVTSRTVVADRVNIPLGTTIVKLEPFNDDDIADWLGRWKRANADAIIAGTMGALTVSAVQRQPELAEQPLLLLMLALYAADPDLPPIDEEIATGELYRRLFDEFARREAGKGLGLGLGHDPLPDELEQQVQDHLDRLAVAAVGMFNRGRQDISEEELGKDLEALEPRLMERPRPVRAGQRIIGEFFFVHAPEARTIADQRVRNGQPQRAYEFLHATFGEYLVARRVMDELVDVAAKAFSGRRGPTEPDDDLLFALLSQQVLAARKSMLDFTQEIFSSLDDNVRPQIFEMLDVLVRTYRNRHGSDRYAAYRPMPPDQVRQLARYSANLVALRVLLDSDSSGIPLAELLRVPEPSLVVLEEWRVTPLLWKSGLDTDGLRAMLTLLSVAGSPPRLSINKFDLSLIPFELSLARLIGDEVTEKRLRYGTAIYDKVSYYSDVTSWADMMSSWLIPAIAGIGDVPEFLPTPPKDTPDRDIEEVAKLIFRYLRSSPYQEADHRRILQLLFKMPAVFKFDKLALTAAVIGRPDLREAVPELQDFEIYGHYAEIVRRADRRYLTSKDQITNWRDPSDHVIYAVEDVLRKVPVVDLVKGKFLDADR